jgi:polysaccharide biosynthesis protein VpsQ
MRHLLTALYCGVIALVIYLADHSQTQYVLAWVRAIPWADKIGHFLLVGGMSFVLNYSFKAKRFWVGPVSFLTASVIVFTIMTLEEVSQIFIATRSFDPGDLLFDYAGIWLFGLLAKRACLREADDGFRSA